MQPLTVTRVALSLLIALAAFLAVPVHAAHMNTFSWSFPGQSGSDIPSPISGHGFASLLEARGAAEGEIQDLDAGRGCGPSLTRVLWNVLPGYLSGPTSIGDDNSSWTIATDSANCGEENGPGGPVMLESITILGPTPGAASTCTTNAGKFFEFRDAYYGSEGVTPAGVDGSVLRGIADLYAGKYFCVNDCRVRAAKASCMLIKVSSERGDVICDVSAMYLMTPAACMETDKAVPLAAPEPVVRLRRAPRATAIPT